MNTLNIGFYEKRKLSFSHHQIPILCEPRCEKTGLRSFRPDRTQTRLYNHTMARGLKFRILEVEGLYYLCSENKGADQLLGYHEADLRLCFRICEKPVFLRRCSFVPLILSRKIITSLPRVYFYRYLFLGSKDFQIFCSTF